MLPCKLSAHSALPLVFHEFCSPSPLQRLQVQFSYQAVIVLFRAARTILYEHGNNDKMLFKVHIIYPTCTTIKSVNVDVVNKNIFGRIFLFIKFWTVSELFDIMVLHGPSLRAGYVDQLIRWCHFILFNSLTLLGPHLKLLTMYGFL